MHLSPRHRHWVGLPLFLGVLGLSMAIAGSDLRADVTPVPTENTWTDLGQGQAVYLMEGADASFDNAMLALREGEILLVAEGIAEVQTPVARIVSFRGAVFIALHGDVLTVASLDASSLIMRGSLWAAVPPRSQVTPRGESAGLPQELPISFFATQQTLLAGRPALEAGRASADNVEALWVLQSLHGETAAQSWVQTEPPFLRQSTRRLLLETFPLIDTAQDALPELIVQKWRDSAHSLVLEEGSDVFETILTSVETLESWLGRDDYPERLNRYGRMLRDIAEGTMLEPALQERLDAYLAREDSMQAIAEPTVVPTAAESQPQPQPQPFLSPTESEHLRHLTIQRLHELQAAFTLETAVTAASRTSVLVIDVVFAGTAQDHIYAFSYDPETDTFSRIRKDDEALPFSVAGSGFLEWLKRQ